MELINAKFGISYGKKEKFGIRQFKKKRQNEKRV